MKFLVGFLLRWLINAFGLWLTLQLVGSYNLLPGSDRQLSVYLTAGFILSLLNIFIKPFISLISFPLTILTLGLFTVVINGFMVYLALQLTPNIDVGFWSAVAAAVVIGILNYGINQTIDAFEKK